MTDAIKIVGGDRARALIQQFGRNFPKAVEREVTAFALDVTAGAKRKVSGDVLKVRTGRLRRSIHPEVLASTGRVDGTVGTNVEYAAAFELGFKGSVSVRSFVRQQVKAFGRSIAPVSVTVRAHNRNVDIAPRSFLMTALNEASPPLPERMRAMLTAVKP